MPFTLSAPAGVMSFESRTGNTYTVSGGIITVPLGDLSDALSAGFTQTSLATLLPSLSATREPFIKSPLPTTVTYYPSVGNVTSSSPISNAQTIYAIPSPSLSPNSAYFGFYGAPIANIARRNSAYPQYFVAQNLGTPEAQGAQSFTVAFDHIGAQLDILYYQASTAFAVFIDGAFLDYYAPAIRAGTAQAGSSTNTLTLDAGASATSGYYNQSYLTVTGGAGTLGDTRLITAYNGTTKVATVASNWTTTTDATTTFAVVNSANGKYLSGNTGDLNLLDLNWNGVIAKRRIEVIGGAFMGVNIGQYDSLAPALPAFATRAVLEGDSIVEGAGGPFATPLYATTLARYLGLQEWNEGEGGTGWCAAGTNRLSLADRIAPPSESWTVLLGGSSGGVTGGNFTLSVTYNGTTQTTGNIAYNAAATAVQSAINGLSNVPSNSASVGGNGTNQPYFVILHNMPGATIALNGSGLTGSTVIAVSKWTGTVAPCVPYLNGVAQPFLLVVQGSGNDFGSGFTAAQVQASATYTAQQIALRFPTAITIFTGIVSVSTQGGGGVVSAGDVSFNTAIKAAAAYLPPVNGQLAYVETYSGGIGSNNWIFGGGSVASPTANKNDILISAQAAGHPTGAGAAHLAGRVAQGIKSLLGAQ